MMATRKRLATWSPCCWPSCCMAGAAFLVRQMFFGPKTITAYFPTATAIYPGDEVRVSGVEGRHHREHRTEGTQTKLILKVDRDVPVPADAKAVIVAQNLIAARYVQLTPAYRQGDGPKMADGAVIPSDRTAVPVEWDEVKTQLMRLATELGPKPAGGESGHLGCPGSSTARPTRWTATATSCGRRWPSCPVSARIFAEGSGNIVDIIKNLQNFVTALRDSKQQIVMFQNRLATSDQRGRRQQVRPGRGADGPVGRDRRGAALRRGQPRADRRADSAPGQRHPEPRRQQAARSRTSCTSRRTRSPTTTTSTTRRPAVRDRGVLVRQLRQPGVRSSAA